MKVELENRNQEGKKDQEACTEGQEALLFRLLNVYIFSLNWFLFPLEHIYSRQAATAAYNMLYIERNQWERLKLFFLPSTVWWRLKFVIQDSFSCYVVPHFLC